MQFLFGRVVNDVNQTVKDFLPGHGFSLLLELRGVGVNFVQLDVGVSY